MGSLASPMCRQDLTRRPTPEPRRTHRVPGADARGGKPGRRGVAAWALAALRAHVRVHGRGGYRSRVTPHHSSATPARLPATSLKCASSKYSSAPWTLRPPPGPYRHAAVVGLSRALV